MARNPGIPSYRRKGSQAVVTLSDFAGRRRDYRLGTYGTAESKGEYARIVGEWQEGHRRHPLDGKPQSDVTINELILAFWQHVERHYRHQDGSPTSEVTNFKCALRVVKQLYGNTLASSFGPLALKSVRRSMIETGLVRQVVNRRVSRVRMMFKWAVAEELLKSHIYEALRTVTGLEAGRTEAPDRPPVQPVSGEHVEAVLPHLDRYVSSMVQVQRLTGMRPGEVIAMKRSEIDMLGAVWMYRPVHHKLSYRGKQRVIGIGPKAQEILRGFFTPEFDDFLFSPIRARAERFKAIRAERKTPVQPSQASRQKRNPRRIPGDRYTGAAYTRAIRRACIKADVPPWKPNQLRHAFATQVRKQFGLEAAQVGLGHAKANITEIYAEANAEFAATIAAQVG